MTHQKRYCILIFVFSVFCTVSVSAQSSIIKLGLSDLSLKGLNLEYEYLISSKKAATVEFNYAIPGSVPSYLIELFEGDATVNDIGVSSSRYTSFSFSTTYRIYTGSNAPSGLFFEPFFKHSQHNMDLVGDFNDAGEGWFDVPSSGYANFSFTSIGMQMGYQWLINDKVVINWSFFGFGGSRVNLDAYFTATEAGKFDQWRLDVIQALEDFPIDYSDNITVVSDPANKEMTGTGTIYLPAIRMGLSVGIMLN